ncbi:hypothetical protein [Moorena sp. SIO3I8]|uniref:hypothetical protein n=1 Tax=Moorena sp. SIO3I8 TaxID=2607833 RepID=UPI0013C1D6FB|nr:hypothetical protein [Moorena sp. SIO3I8]NEO04952.1 hypothetical protein [Moorena sp. SIO3I8]
MSYTASILVVRYGADYLNPGYEIKNKRAFWWCVTGRAISTLATKLKISEHFGGALRDGLSQPWLRS